MVNVGVCYNKQLKSILFWSCYLKLLHTSDWHLGRTLYLKKRYSEFQSFLDWLIQQIQLLAPDVLIVAGDIFDTTAPSNKAQEIYYQFLCKVATLTKCQHIVIIGGNHDSPTLLNAPKELLKQLKIHVLGNISANPQDEVLELLDRQGQPMALVCAVPYLRDKDVRNLADNESASDKDLKLMQAIKQHYAEVCQVALARRQELGSDIPIIATGHLFVTGGKTLKDDGVRELYVGSLAQFGSNDFPAEIDYLALGHLHIAQTIANKTQQRYSGSPIAMGFGEAKQTKIILQVDFTGKLAQVTEISVPTFQRLERVTGNLAQISAQLNGLIAQSQSIWVEVDYTGDEIISGLQHSLDELVRESQVELVTVHNSQLVAQLLSTEHFGGEIELSSLTPEDVFSKCLTINQVPDEQQLDLNLCFQQVVAELNLTDLRAE